MKIKHLTAGLCVSAGLAAKYGSDLTYEYRVNPDLLGGLKVSVTLSVIGAVVGEFVAADRGLGFLINVARGNFDTPLMFVALLTLVVIALLLYLVVVLTEALLLRGYRPENIYLSMERNMKCAVGLCGHCQFGPAFICRDGPVLRYDRVRDLLALKEF